MSDHSERMRELLRLMFSMDPDKAEKMMDMFSPSPSEHSLAAETILASSEVMAALVRNGVRATTLRDRVFGVLSELAKPFPGLSDLVKNWLEDGMENSFRLSELRDYNDLLRGGKLREEIGE